MAKRRTASTLEDAAAGGRQRTRRSACPVACTLDLIGDRWTLLIVRDLLLGKARFGDFLSSSEGIPTNILAARLKRLEEAGLIEAHPYSEHPPRFEYHLTSEGRELGPVVHAVGGWGLAHIPDTRALPLPPD